MIFTVTCLKLQEAMEKWEAFVQAICIDAPLSIAA
jgi:hypothetical protein